MAEIPLSIDPSKSSEPLRDLADQLERIQGEVKNTENSFQSAFGKSTDAVDETTVAIEDQTKAQKKNADEVEKLEKGVVDFGKKSKKAFDDSSVDEFKKSTDAAEDSVDDLDDGLDDLGKKGESVFGGLSEGIGDIGGEFEGLGGSLLSGEGGGVLGGLGGILGKLGPIGVAAGAIVGTVGAIGAEVVELDMKFDGLRETVSQLFDVTGDALDDIVVNVEAIANTFDQEVNDVILTTNTLVKEFGITADEATNLLERGFNSSANAQGDLLDSAREFSAQIRASGGDAEDLFAILEKSNEEGIFSDKGIDVVKEFGLRIREQAEGTSAALESAFGADFTNELLAGVDSGAISSIEALKLVSAELGTLDENSQEAQTVIADVFGGAGEDAGFRFLTLLKDINDEQGFGNEQLTEQQQRQQETLEANQRLARAQNELSKALGDSSSFGRLWIEVQTGFFEILVAVIQQVGKLADGFRLLSEDPIAGLQLIGEVVFDYITLPVRAATGFINEAIEALTGFEDLIPTFSFGAEAAREWTAAQEDQIEITRIAQTAIRDFGSATAVATGKIGKYFDQLAEGNITEERRVLLAQQLTEEYGEQIGELDLLTASEEELLEVKNKIIQAEVEATIAQGKAIAIRQINNEILIRQNQLLNENLNEQTRKRLEDEIQFLEVNAMEKLELVEQETRIRLGLEQAVNDDIVDDAENTQDELTDAAGKGQDDRKKQQDEFNKAIQEILKRGQQARLNDQFVSEEERIQRQLDFQRQELANLKSHAEDLNEQLTGSRELDQEVIDAFNLADEKLITDAQDKIFAIQERRRREERMKQLQNDKAILDAKKERFDIELSLLEQQEQEEIAIIEQQTRRRGESEAAFERRIQLEKLQANEFYLQQRQELLDRELALKINELNLELDALADKEGEEVDIKRRALEEKRDLLEQETDTQKAQLDLQIQNTQDAITEIENTVPSLGEVFDNIQTRFAESLGLSVEQLQAISAAVQQVAGEIFNTIQESLSEQISANDELISKLEEREEEANAAIERELEFAQAGYAANVEAKRAELAQIQEAQEDAERERRELVEQQRFLDEISQISSLVTASANLYSTLSPLPFGIGIALATALTGAMFAAFVATKAKARNVASLEKGGSGDTLGMITGNRHSNGGEAFLDHVEVEDGEMWSVFSRKATGKYADLISSFTDAVNGDNVESFFMKKGVPDKMMKKSARIDAEGVELQSIIVSNNLSDDLSTLPEIRDAVKKKFAEPDVQYIEKDGDIYRVETYPNGSEKRKKLSIRG